MGNKALNSCLVLAVVVVLAVFALRVRVGSTADFAADAVVVLKTTGMTCGSCIGKVTKALQSEKGVAATEVDLVGGLVIAVYDSKQVTPELLAEAVSASGFPSRVQVVLTPEQFKAMVGRDIGGAKAAGGCCGSKGCGGKS